MTLGEYKHPPKPDVRVGIGLLIIGVVMAGWGFWQMAEFMQANGASAPFRGRVVLHAMFAVLGVVSFLRGVRTLLSRR
ncbi:hypothetical protein [Noviluteimonas gilva]|uniref:Uncharacterized protein n=1 Tax=Noviluteimonas gilva TaxID=2682097 RepID=A0A7C9MKP5_9GAMM|nr:hypothetical protein [Lysobacter gilvus]MUV12967.1 hypothetical protein [Lysobacter gilvus]